MVQPSQDQTLPPSLHLQAPQALQEVVQATPPGVARWAAKWRTRPRQVNIKMGEELFGRITLPPVQGADGPEDSTPHRSPLVPAVPLALAPPSRSDRGYAPQPQVSSCPACSMTGSLESGCACTYPVHLHVSHSRVLTWVKLHDLQAVVQCWTPVAHVAHSVLKLLSAMLAVLVHLHHAAVQPGWALAWLLKHAFAQVSSDVDLRSDPVLCSWMRTWRQGPSV